MNWGEKRQKKVLIISLFKFSSMAENYNEQPDEFKKIVFSFLSITKKYSLIIETVLIVVISISYLLLSQFNRGFIISSLFVFILAFLNFITAFVIFDIDYTKQNSLKSTVFVKYLSFWSKSMILINFLLLFYKLSYKETGFVVGSLFLSVSVLIAVYNRFKKNKSEIFKLKEILRNIFYLAVVLYYYYSGITI